MSPVSAFRRTRTTDAPIERRAWAAALSKAISPTATPLLEQVDAEIVSATADVAYDGAPTYDTVATHGEDIAVVIPPSATAVLNDDAATLCSATGTLP